MRFGGHQTFFVREGWLSKGLQMLIEEPERFDDPYVADYLGVGRNMAKSIEHWLEATGLAEKRSREERRTMPRLASTRLSRIISEFDPHFTHITTWWFLHINLVRSPAHAATWHWFFNYFPANRFERGGLLTSLTRHERTAAKRPPAQSTLERDISCFLGSYASEVPNRRKDPEEEIDCPFQELGILRHYRASGYYEVSRRKKRVDAEVVLYALNGCGIEASGTVADIGFHELTRTTDGPIQTLVLTSDDLFEHLAQLEQLSFGVQISGLAGDRQIRFPVTPLPQLATAYFERVGERAYA